MSSFSIEQTLQQAIAHHRAGELSQAEQLYRQILQIQPQHPDANHNLGVLAQSLNKMELALPFFKTALDVNPKQAQFWLSYIEALIKTNQIETAHTFLINGKKAGLQGEKTNALTEQLAQLMEKSPSELQINQVVDVFGQGNYQKAEQAARELIQQFPKHPFGWKALGVILSSLGRSEEALQIKIKSVALAPNDADAFYNLGNNFRELHRLEEAEKTYRQAIKLQPDFADTYINLGLTLQELGHLLEAEKVYNHVLTLKTDNAELFYNFGITLQELRQFSKAEKIYRQAIALKPDHAKAYNNLGNVLKELGCLQEAHDCYRTTLTLQPDCADAQSNVLYLYDYVENYCAEFRFKEAKHYGEIVAKKVALPYRQWLCASPANRLRIGFVSGDFRNHPVGYFLENMLRHLAQQDFELVAYSACRTADEVTERLKNYFTQWQPIFTLDNAQAARLIHQDGIHILFDLSGHTGFSRLPLFSWKPAPLQISWLGYWATTGVAEIDYVLVDKVGVPETQQIYFTEKLAYLPNTRLCFSPPNVELAVASLPALSNGYITFGCFQNSTKVTDEVLELWQKILTHLPTARLRFQSKQLSDEKFVQSFWQRLQNQGIDCQRVSFHDAAKREQYLAAHAQVDLILDTFPYTGGTTTCEALWMGVPTLTLVGESLLARQGASLLSAAGLSDWIVYDKQNYFEKAIQIATEVTELATLRARLREQVLASPLFDAPLFAKNFAQVLQALWHDRKFAD